MVGAIDAALHEPRWFHRRSHRRLDGPRHFTKFYDKIDLGPAASIAMIGSDGVVRASGGSAAGRFALGSGLDRDVAGSAFQRGRNTIFEFKDAQDHSIRC